MSANSEFKFQLSVSKECFEAKPSDKQTAYIKFQPRDLTIEEALQCAKEGHAFCYSFYTSSKDGITISTWDKTKNNFRCTSTIIYDMDDMTVPMTEFIESLPYKPSFAYPTYSDGVAGFRYRLAYVFDSEIWGEPLFVSLYDAIVKANSFPIEDKKRKQGGLDKRGVNQLYFGTKPDVATYNSNIIYSITEFEQFAIPPTEPEFNVPVVKSDGTNITITIDKEFLSDFRHLSPKAFYCKYKDAYYHNYKPSLETPLILHESGMYYTYPEDYVHVQHNMAGKHPVRWGIDTDRKKRIYVAAQTMLHNLPSLTVENLLFNLSIERQWYYENDDNKVNHGVLIQAAINAFTKPSVLKPSNHSPWRVNKEYWAAMGMNPNQAKIKIRHILLVKDINKFIKPELSVKENQALLKEHGITVTQKTLKTMVSNGEIKINKSENRSTYLSCLPDADTILLLKLIKKEGTISQAAIAKVLGVSLSTVKRIFRELRGTMIVRDGDNRTGEWVVLPPFDKYV